MNPSHRRRLLATALGLGLVVAPLQAAGLGSSEAAGPSVAPAPAIGGEAATAGADDEHIHAGVERFRTHRAAPVGTAVRTANPAINSGAAR